MALVRYNKARLGLADGSLELDTADIRVLLLEAASDLDADDDTVAAVLARAGTTELTSTGYARVALANEVIVEDEVNDRAELDADDAVFIGVSQAGAEQVVAYLVFKQVTNDADSIPIFADDRAPELPLTPNGSNITLTIPAEGLIQF